MSRDILIKLNELEDIQSQLHKIYDEEQELIKRKNVLEKRKKDLHFIIATLQEVTYTTA